jgi:hypothetical protein
MQSGITTSWTIKKRADPNRGRLLSVLPSVESCQAVAASSSRIAAFALSANSEGISANPWSLLACSFAFSITSSTVAPRATKSQSTPTSRHFNTFVILDLHSPTREPLCGDIIRTAVPSQRVLRTGTERVHPSEDGVGAFGTASGTPALPRSVTFSGSPESVRDRRGSLPGPGPGSYRRATIDRSRFLAR